MVQSLFEVLFEVLFAVRQALPPLEVASTLGVVLFALSWIVPRRLVTLPTGQVRASALTWVGVLGALAIAAVITFASAMPFLTGRSDWNATDGRWTRPAPLVAAGIVILVAGLLLRREAGAAPEHRAIRPQQSWRSSSPRRLLVVAGFAAAGIGLTSLWQTAIGVTAPEDATFIGNVPEHSELPVYMRFNGGFGFVAGAGWPNTLATMVVLVSTIACFVLVLRADANRPVALLESTVLVRRDRELTARLLSWILLGGLVATLGAVWMHTGSIGQGLVGFEDQRLSGDVSRPQVYLAGGYDAIARPMNLLGYALQALGFALLLRVATDTARAALARRRAPVPPPVDSATVGARR